jgi:hypothetical protein
MDGNFISSYGPSDLHDIVEFRDDVYNEIYDDDGTGNKEIRENFLPIAECNSSMMLLLGYNGDYVDKIYIDLISIEPRIKYVSDNIFEFCRNTYLSIGKNSFSYLKEQPKFYKNFEEDFWRIRDDGDASSIFEQKNEIIANLEKEKGHLQDRLRILARNEKKSGIPLELISNKYGFSVEELSSEWF